MAIHKRKDSKYYYAKVYVKKLGRSVSFSTGKADEAEAREVERAFKNAQARNLPSEKIHAIVDALYGAEDARAGGEGITLAIAYERYREALKARGREQEGRNIKYKRTTLNRLIEWLEANHPTATRLKDITRTIAGRFACDYHAREGLSDKTKREAIATLGTIWNVLMGTDDTIKENPWRYFLRTINDQKIGLAFTREQEERILSVAIGTEWHTACLLARTTGLRFGDIAHLQWGDVDWEKRAIRLQPSKTKKHGISVILPLTDRLYKILKAKRRTATWTAVLPEINKNYPKTEKLQGGKFADILREAGVDPSKYTFHSWRHTFRTRLSEAGVSDDIAKRLGGWTQDKTAMRYDHAERLEDLRKAVEMTIK